MFFFLYLVLCLCFFFRFAFAVPFCSFSAILVSITALSIALLNVRRLFFSLGWLIEKTRATVFGIKTICTNFRIFKQIRKENIFKTLCEYSVRHSMFDFLVFLFYSVRAFVRFARAFNDTRDKLNHRLLKSYRSYKLFLPVLHFRFAFLSVCVCVFFSFSFFFLF